MDTLTGEDTDTTTFELPDLDVKEISIRNIDVKYHDVVAGQKATVEGLSMCLDGMMRGNQLQATLSSSLREVSVVMEGDSEMSARVEEVTLDMRGYMQGVDAKADVKVVLGSVDALMPDMEAHVAQVQWELNGAGADGQWTGSTVLTTQPVVATIEGEAPMSAALAGLQFKADGQWMGKDIMVSPTLQLPGLTVGVDGERMLENADIQLRATLHTDTLLEKLAFSEGLLALNEHEITLEGRVEMPDTSTINADMSFDTNRCDIAQLLALVPQSYRELLDGIDVRGGMSLKSSGRGALVDGEMRIGGADATLRLDNIDLLYNDSIALQSGVAKMNVVYDGAKDRTTGRMTADVLHAAMTGMAEADLKEVNGLTIAKPPPLMSTMFGAKVCSDKDRTLS